MYYQKRVKTNISLNKVITLNTNNKVNTLFSHLLIILNMKMMKYPLQHYLLILIHN